MKVGTNSEVNGTKPATSLTRRRALTATSTGIVAALALTSRVNAADWTSAEKANAQIVSDFCAAWSSHNFDKIMSFFAGNSAYRVSETQEPVKGKEAVGERIKSFVDRVKEFEVLDTLAKGPMVFNERIDHFTGGPLKSWHGVGVFFLKEGKIVEWYDYTIALDRG
jgi:limonene-1,2-epoxide hydrolase